MSNKEIPLVPAAAQLDGTEQAHVVQGGNSRRSTVEDISAFGRTWFRFVSRTVAAQPASPAEGDYYIIPTGATGAVWAGDDGKIACFRNGEWQLTVPIEGDAGWVGDEETDVRYSDAAWETIEATAAQFRTGTATNKYLSPDKVFDAAASVALTDGATVTPDFGAGFNFTWAIAGNRTLANPTNAKPGQQGKIEVTQDGTGSRLISAYGSNYRFAGGTDIVLSTAAGARDLLYYDVLSDGTIFLAAQKAIAA